MTSSGSGKQLPLLGRFKLRSVDMFLVLILVCMLPAMSETSCNDCAWTPFPPRQTLGCLRPRDPRALMDHELNLTCTANNSSELYFTWSNTMDNGSNLMSYTRVISPCILELYMFPFRGLNISEEPGSLTINCRRRGTSDTWSQLLMYEYAPHTIAGWDVVIDNWDTLKLDVQLGRYLHPGRVRVLIKWRADLTEKFNFCSNNTTCFLDSSDFANADSYNFTVTVSTSLAEEEYVSSIHVETRKYVKPAKVGSLKIQTDKRFVKLEWNKQYRPVIYRVETGNTTVNTTLLNNATITRLRPYTRYEFCVRVQSDGSNYWSEKNCKDIRTQEDAPEKGPYISGYTEQLNGVTRTVILYMKPPDEKFQNGILKNYIVEVSSGDNRVVPCCSAYSITLQISANEHNISVSVNNSAGSSPKTRRIIPPVSRVHPPKQVRVAYNDSTVRVSWVATPEAETTSVAWCESGQEYEICKGPVHELFVSGKQSSAVVPVKGEDINRFQFGVAVTTKSGNSSLTWSNCVYDTNRVPEKKPALQPLESVPRLSLTVRWSLPTCTERALVTGYTLQWCAATNSSGNCEIATIDVPAENHVISNLQEGVSYEVRLKEISPGGHGPFSDPEFGVPVETNLKAGAIAGIVISVLIVTAGALFGFVIFARNIRTTWTKKEPITLPGFSDDSSCNGYNRSSPCVPSEVSGNTVMTRASSVENINRADPNSTAVKIVSESSAEVNATEGSSNEAMATREPLAESKGIWKPSADVEAAGRSAAEVNSAWESDGDSDLEPNGVGHYVWNDDNSPESPYVDCDNSTDDFQSTPDHQYDSNEDQAESPDLTSEDSLPSGSPYAEITVENHEHPDSTHLHSNPVQTPMGAESKTSRALGSDSSSSASSSAPLIDETFPSGDLVSLSTHPSSSNSSSSSSSEHPSEDPVSVVEVDNPLTISQHSDDGEQLADMSASSYSEVTLGSTGNLHHQAIGPDSPEVNSDLRTSEPSTSIRDNNSACASGVVSPTMNMKTPSKCAASSPRVSRDDPTLTSVEMTDDDTHIRGSIAETTL